ncbi:MAG: hypothetical protein JW910_03810, partial [Anaerolineae bacterium]|nr:hypothetical protein [Anaerolineae bacterium]
MRIWTLTAATVDELVAVWEGFPESRGRIVAALPAFASEKEIADLVELHDAVAASPLADEYMTKPVYHVSERTGKCWAEVDGRLFMICPVFGDLVGFGRFEPSVPVGVEAELRKLEVESEALQGQVFDVLGPLFQDTPLRKLLVEAVRYGDQPEVRAKLDQAVDNAIDRERVRDLLEARSLATQTLDISRIQRVRADMERYAARRLQPHYIRSFFMQALGELGGSCPEREPGRYRITHVPASIRNRAKAIGTPLPVLKQYERICFEKDLISVPGQPLAQFICPGHPLLDTIIDMMLDKYRGTLRAGTVLVDPTDPDTTPRVLCFL